MATFYAAPGVARFVISGQYAEAENIVNVVHIQRRNDGAFSPWSQPELRNAALRLAFAWQHFLPDLSNLVKWLEISSRDLANENGSVDLFGVSLQGASASAPLPPSNSLLIQWRTGTAGRGANGRSYLPGSLEGYTDSMGRIDAGIVATMTQKAGNVLADLGAATTELLPGPPLDLVILHKERGIPLSRSANKVLSGRCSNLISTQRRRLPKRS
jgi:hypothetical protein